MAVKINRLKLIIRSIMFFLYLFLYFFNQEYLVNIMEQNIIFGISVLHIIWVFLMIELIIVPIPFFNYYINRGKQFKKYYIPSTNASYSKGLTEHTKIMNHRAAVTMTIWLIITGTIGSLYIKRIIGKMEMYLIMLFFYLGDQICINIWCPFQFFIMKEKCCTACRIYNWGHFMMYSHFVFIPNFFTLSLFGMGLLILIQWEYMHYKYPYRFYEGTNLALQCSNCNTPGCKIKRYTNIFMEKIFIKFPIPTALKKFFIQDYYNQINSHHI